MIFEDRNRWNVACPCGVGNTCNRAMSHPAQSVEIYASRPAEAGDANGMVQPETILPSHFASAGNAAGAVEMRPRITSSTEMLWSCNVKPMARSS